MKMATVAIQRAKDNRPMQIKLQTMPKQTIEDNWRRRWIMMAYRRRPCRLVPERSQSHSCRHMNHPCCYTVAGIRH